MIDWGYILNTLGGAAIVTAAFAFVAKTLIGHLFSRDLANHKATLDEDAEVYKSDLKRQADEALAAQKAEFDRQMATFQVGLDVRVAHADRIRQQVVHWANPILGAVEDLQGRLRNILWENGYLALSFDTEARVNAE